MSFLHGVEVVELDGGPRPINGVASSVIGLVGTARKGSTNVPILVVGSRKEAIAQFGVPDGVSTIPDALDAIFDQSGALVVAPWSACCWIARTTGGVVRVAMCLAPERCFKARMVGWRMAGTSF